MSERAPMDEVAVGLDVGTSGLKATVYRLSDGEIVANRKFQYTEPEIGPGVSRARRYLEVVVGAIRAVGETYRVASVALSTQMYSFVALRGGEEVIYQWNSVWPDDENAYAALSASTEVSGCPPASLFPSYKILVARQTQPDLVILPYGLQEYLAERLTGRRVVDRCCASASGFRNVVQGVWNESLLEAAGLKADAMPEVVAFNQTVGPITHEGLTDLGTIQFATGLGDGPSASYATYGIANITANIGTSMAVRSFVTDVSNLDFSKVWTFEIASGMWVAGAISSNGCAVLDKFQDIGFLHENEIDPSRVDNSIQFFPWENGERSPYWSASLRETLVGGHLRSTDEDYGAAVERGVAFTVTRMFEEINDVSTDSEMMCVAGGGANSDVLMAYLSGSLPVRIGLLEDFDYLGARGAAYAAAEAIGAEVKRVDEMKRVVEPTHRYREVYESWRAAADKFAAFYTGRE
ncbi:FGGY family carbohydrate kinase [Schaalia naturae]|uniref:FGGY family carbohydrate kinase n=1 Tax=Schaalia naturae TaxID=635203 RepID=A0ABW2SPC0_9ACTO